MTAPQFLTTEQQGRVLIATINAPPVNAIGPALLDELDSLLDMLENQLATADWMLSTYHASVRVHGKAEQPPTDFIKVLIITGTGNSFAAGADVKLFLSENADSIEEYIARGHRVLDRLSRLPIPTIAAINGACLGGGLELALACDLRVAVERTILGLPEITLGIFPGWGGTQRLPRLIGMGHALEMMLSGIPITATEAKALGLVTHVGQDALREALELGQVLAQKSWLALRGLLRSVYDGFERPLPEGLAIEREQFKTTATSHDRAEGIRAFLEKRAPTFNDC